jgi:dTDP-4-dehydrorhamnose reductase
MAYAHPGGRPGSRMHGDLLTPYDMALLTADYFGLDKSLIKKADSSTFSQPARRPPKTGFVLDKARQVLGYNPKSFSEGIGILAQQIKQGR